MPRKGTRSLWAGKVIRQKYTGAYLAAQYRKPGVLRAAIAARPWVDRFVLTQVQSHKTTADLVEARDGGYWVTRPAKKILIPAYNEWMLAQTTWESRRMSRTGQIFRQAAELAQLIRLTMKRP